MATGRSRTEIAFIDKGVSAGSPSGISIGCALFAKMGQLGISDISDYTDLLRRYTPNERLDRGYSPEYAHLKNILLRNKNVLVSRVIEKPKNSGIVFYYDSFSREIKFKSVTLKEGEVYNFLNKSEFMIISTKYPGAWSENTGIQFSKGTVTDTFKLEVVMGLFENKKSIITSGGYVVEKFDNLHFDHTNIDNYVEMINYDSKFIKITHNRESFSEPIEKFKQFPEVGEISQVKSIDQEINNGVNNLTNTPVNIPGTNDLIKYVVKIDKYVENNTYVLYINGNRYEVSTDNTTINSAEKVVDEFISKLTPIEPSLSLTKDGTDKLVIKETVGAFNFTPIDDDKTELIVTKAVPNQTYKFQIINEQVEVKFISTSKNQTNLNNELAAKIATELSKLEDLEILTVNNKVQIKRLDPSLNIKATITYPVVKLMDNLLLSIISVLMYRKNNGEIDLSTVSSKYVLKNIVDFDGASGHTYSSLSVFGSKSPELETVNIINPSTGDYEYSSGITRLENKQHIDILPYSIWDVENYKFRNDELLLFTSKNPGNWGNDIQIFISDQEDERIKYTNTFIVDVVFKNYTETFEVSLDKNARSGYNQSLYIVDVINTESKYVDVEVNPNISAEELIDYLPHPTIVKDTLTEKKVNIFINLSGGYDGIPLVSEYIDAIAKFKEANYGIKIIASLGNEFDDYLRELGVVGKAIDALPVVSVPRALTLRKDINAIIKWAKSLNLQDNGAIYFNRSLEFNSDLNYDVEITADTLMASFAGEVITTYNRVSEPIAGLEKTAVIGSKGLLVTINSAEEDRLYDNNINPLSMLNNVIYINGQKTMKLIPGFLDRINVKLYTLFKKPVLKNILDRYRFRLQLPETRDEIVTELNASFQTDVNNKIIKPGFVIQCNEVNNPETNDQHELHINIKVCPIESIEYIFATCTLTKNTSNLSFSL